MKETVCEVVIKLQDQIKQLLYYWDDGCEYLSAVGRCCVKREGLIDWLY